VPTDEDIKAVRDMPKERWFSVREVPVEQQYKTLIYLLEEQPADNGYTLITASNYLRFMWQKT
jgi:hypothetical protein